MEDLKKGSLGRQRRNVFFRTSELMGSETSLNPTKLANI